VYLWRWDKKASRMCAVAEQDKATGGWKYFDNTNYVALNSGDQALIKEHGISKGPEPDPNRPEYTDESQTVEYNGPPNPRDQGNPGDKIVYKGNPIYTYDLNTGQKVIVGISAYIKDGDVIDDRQNLYFDEQTMDKYNVHTTLTDSKGNTVDVWKAYPVGSDGGPIKDAPTPTSGSQYDPGDNPAA